MIQEFADWLVYDLFGLDAGTPVGVAVNFFFLRYNQDFNSIVFH